MPSRSLGYEGWFARTAASGGEAVQAASTVRPDAVVMALDLPDMDGPEVVRLLRSTSPCLPVVFLAAGNGGAGRVARLQSGSDCLAKPFRLEELAARLHQLLPQTKEAAADRELVVVGNLTLDEHSREVSRNGEPIRLTGTEFELLRFFMRHPRRVLSKAQIVDRVWNYDFAGRTNIVELYVSYLRCKIDKGRAPMIHTVRGVGYVLKPASA